MKPTQNLFQQIIAWPNLTHSANRAREGKRQRADVLEFQFQLEHHLLRLQQRLRNETWRPAPMRSFEITDPKRRLISAAPYGDRVVHHAVCAIIEPLFEKGFIYDSWACRSGKGQHSAIQRAQKFLRHYPWILKTDVRKYFPSIDHQILLRLVAKRIKDPQTLRLLETIIRHPWPGQSRPASFPGDDLFTPLERSCGLPIGNLTSQLCGNIYLDRVDHWLLEQLRVPAYLRYMDDLVIFADDKKYLWHVLQELRTQMTQLRLKLHPRKTQIQPSRCGLRFLGYRITAERLAPVPETIVRFRRRLRQLQQDYDTGKCSIDEIQQSLASYWGHFQLARTPSRIRTIVQDFPFFKDLQAAQQLKQEQAEKKRERSLRSR